MWHRASLIETGTSVACFACLPVNVYELLCGAAVEMSEASGFMVAGLDVTGKKRQRHIRDNSNNTGWVRRL